MRTGNTQPPVGTPIDRSHPLCKGLVGCWLFNEGGGQKAVDSTGINYGTFSNAPTFTKSARGSCLDFASGSKRITLPHKDALNITGDLTMACWIKKVSANTETVVIGCYQGGGAFPGYGFGIGVNGGAHLHKLAFYSSGAGNWVNGLSTNIDNDTWKHIAVTLNGTSVRFYVNGVADGVVTSAAPGSYVGQRSLGASELGNFFISLVQDIRIYNRALSQTEIEQLYINPYQIFQDARPLKK